MPPRFFASGIIRGKVPGETFGRAPARPRDRLRSDRSYRPDIRKPTERGCAALLPAARKPRSTEEPAVGRQARRTTRQFRPDSCGMRYARSVRHLRPQHAPRTRPDRRCARNIRTETGLAATGSRSVRHRKSGRIRQPAEESELRREAARNTRWIRLATESGYERPIRTGPLSPPGRNGHRDGRRSVSPPNSAL